MTQREDERARLYALVAAAGRVFRGATDGPSGPEARRYLEKRGLDSARRSPRFRLGYAPNEQVGPEGTPGQGRILDGRDDRVGHADRRRRYPGRPTIASATASCFPSPNCRGRVIAFGGRALDPDAPAKYLNSPETPLFHKGGVLFNAHNARGPAHDKDQIIVVEGYMDVIALSEAGFPQTVAPLGTALTEDQLKLLWRMAPEPMLCFDGDAAGRRAAFRAVETGPAAPAARHQRPVRVPARWARSRRSRPPARRRPPSRTMLATRTRALVRRAIEREERRTSRVHARAAGRLWKRGSRRWSPASPTRRARSVRARAAQTL